MRRGKKAALVLTGVAALAAGGVAGVALSPGARAGVLPTGLLPGSTTPTATVTAASAGNFSYGELQSATVGQSGCGTNFAGEPAIHVSKANDVFTSSEMGLGGGTQVWRGMGSLGGTGASGCGLQYEGQPNAVAGAGASGGDTDLAIAPVADPTTGTDRVYVASLNLGSVAVATSTDNGQSWTNVPVQGGLPVDDREWIAAWGAKTSLLTFHDIASNDIDVLRSDSGGAPYTQISQAIPESDYKAGNNELGNIVIDHDNTAGTATNSSGTAPFWAYQSFVAPSTAPANPLASATYDEAWVAVSNDGGYTWTDKPVPCSISPTSGANGLDHQFPNVSVAPNGSLWMTWSDDVNIYAATSSDHGSTWSCSSGPVSSTTNAGQNVMPWIVATSNGVDLVWYGSSSGSNNNNQVWNVYFAQDPTSTAGGWTSPQQLMEVHQGSVCEQGATCNSGRQLFDDFGVDTDQSGWAHISFSEDANSNGQAQPGGTNTDTGYAVQTGGTPAGAPN